MMRMRIFKSDIRILYIRIHILQIITSVSACTLSQRLLNDSTTFFLKKNMCHFFIKYDIIMLLKILTEDRQMDLFNNDSNLEKKIDKI